MRIVTADIGGPEALLDAGSGARAPLLCWLGQAGFLLRAGDLRLMIDPYLSDSLAAKYRGTRFPHTRLMPPPIRAARVTHLDAVLCTHAHTDHMDPDTLGPIAANNPRCRFVVPRAARETAVARGVPPDRLVALNAGEQEPLGPGLALSALASAHEDLATDEQGNHRFLGYVLRTRNVVVYHSGDSVPYPGLADQLAGVGVQVALLPVNGRDAERRAHGVPGNFTFPEAQALCLAAGIRWLVACHFGMFEFNTVDAGWLDQQLAAVPPPLQGLRPRPGQVYRLEDEADVAAGPAGPGTD